MFPPASACCYALRATADFDLDGQLFQGRWEDTTSASRLRSSDLNGIEFCRQLVAGIFAAGDAARWPDPYTGERIHVEHWVVAERQGQVAAKNILGLREKFNVVPFFWSQHYDVAINCVGHAEDWEAIEIDGSLEARDGAVTYKKGGRTLAVVTISRDLQSLRTEAAMEAEIEPRRQEVA